MSFKKIEYLYDISNSSDICISMDHNTIGSLLRAWLKIGDIETIYGLYVSYGQYHSCLLSSKKDMEMRIAALEKDVHKMVGNNRKPAKKYEIAANKNLTLAHRTSNVDVFRKSLMECIRLKTLGLELRNKELVLATNLNAKEDMLYQYRGFLDGYNSDIENVEAVLAAFKSYLSVHDPQRLVSEE
jgi:hypothetical protein